MKYLDEFLNRMTMYRLVLSFLIVLWLWAVFLSLFGKIAYDPISITASTLLLLIFCLSANFFLSLLFKAPTNPESTYITVLILSLVAAPAQKLADVPFIFWLSVLAMTSKYVLTFNKKHLFNPAAAALVLSALIFNRPAVWWVGNPYLLPVVLVGGLLVVRKIKREDLVASFLVVLLLSLLAFSLMNKQNPGTTFQIALADSSLLFFAFVMLTEPQTTPPGRRRRIFYGVLVALFFAPQFHFGSFHFTPELALLTGNLYSYLVGSRQKLLSSNFKKTLKSLEKGEVITASNLDGDFILPRDKTKKLPNNGSVATADSRSRAL